MTEIMMDGEPLEVGDEVYCLIYGKGEVSKIRDNVFPITVQFDSGHADSYTNDFKRTIKSLTRALYWQKPEIIPPPKPKKKVKVWDWVSYCPNGFPLIIHRAMTEQHAVESGLDVRKIDGTEREVER